MESDPIGDSLFAGEIERVFVFSPMDDRMSSTFGRFLPQTLGLEPFSSIEFRSARGGDLTAPEWTATARDIARGRRWIAQGRQPEWATEFMLRAGAVIYISSIWTRLGERDNQTPYQYSNQLEHLALTLCPDKLIYAFSPRQRRQLRDLRVPRHAA
jgi:hypothetical protein